jgi:protein SCO1
MMSARRFLLFLACGLVWPLAFGGGGLRGQSPARYQRTPEAYKLPDITLLSQDRVKVQFKDLASSGKPVALALNYTTCTTVYPLIAAGFANLQRKLGPDAQKVWLISLSIDPEYDTPELMKEYLQRYGAKPGWDFLTGSKKDVVSVMRAFDAYVADKMDKHTPLTFLWLPSENRWIRIHGLMSTKDLMKEIGVGAP